MNLHLRNVCILLLILTLLTGILIPFDLAAAEPSAIPSDAWMKEVTDDAYLNALNIPGTHDSGMYHCGDLTADYAITQSMRIYDQLKSGARIFDIRLRYAGSNDANICHGQGSLFRYDGEVELWSENEQKVKLHPYLYQYALQEIRDFLFEHPSEVVILTVQHEHNANDEKSETRPDGTVIYDINTAKQSAEDALDRELAKHGGRVIRVSKADRKKVTFRLGDVRGCVIIFEYGVDFGDLMPSKLNDYDVTFAEKWNVLLPYFDSAPNQEITTLKSEDEFRACFTSSTGQYAYNEQHEKIQNNVGVPFSDLVIPTPEKEGKGMRKQLLGYTFCEGAYYGWVSMDFLDESLARKIFESNDFKATHIRKTLPTTYVSEIRGFLDSDYDDALEECLNQGYMVLQGYYNGKPAFSNVNPDGYCILIGYKTTTDVNQAITDLVGSYSDQGPSGYTKVTVDNSLWNYFTRGSGLRSRDTYLFYSKSKGKAPITELFLAYGSTGQEPVLEHTSRSVFNLQEGLSRSYQLGVKRDSDTSSYLGTIVSGGNLLILVAGIIILALVIAILCTRRKYRKAGKSPAEEE